MAGRRNFPGLDVLRGAAILLVLSAHFMPAHLAYAPQIATSAANLGVILFFFLSGFLMDQQLALDGSIGAFWVRRCFRILPMYWISILMLLAGGTWSLADALANATFLTPITGSDRMLGVYWTLYIEVLFYAIVPLLRLGGERGIAASLYVVLAAFTLWVTLLGHINNAVFYIVYCFAGLQIGAWYRGQISSTALAIAIASVSVSSAFNPTISPYLALAPLACAGAVIAAMRLPMRSTMMEWIGRVSYSWYLLHTLIGWKVYYLGGNAWTGALLAGLVSLAASAVTFNLIEQPGQRAGKLLVEAIGRWRLSPSFFRAR